MKRLVPALLALLAACGTSGPPAPPLAAELKLVEKGYEEKGGTVSIMSVVGVLNVTISAEGEVESVLKRELLTDIRRRGDLDNAERWELHKKVEAWVAQAAGPEAAAAGQPWGTLTYGTKKVSWAKGDSLSPELNDLVHYVKVVAQSMGTVRTR